MNQKEFMRGVIFDLPFLMGICFIWASGSAKAEAATSLHPDPLTFEIAVGEEKTLAIVLENADQVYAIEVSGTFDINAVEVLDADPSSAGTQLVPGDIPKPDFPATNSADNDLGTFRYVVTEIYPSEPMSGSGTVFSIRLFGQAVGETTLTISAATLADIDGTPLPVSLQNGAIHVIPAHIYLPFILH